ncbi:MAG TPA: clostripain-related cysteine peptidase [Roseiflexaceae bacterium]|nr:clostripain-related cysteine peptidase [Roseiflexaceae bacterium]
MTTSWTWMVYLATNNNVWEHGEQSVERIRAAQLGDGVRVAVQQTTPARTTRSLLGGGPTQQADLGQVDSGAPETLVDFIRWAAQERPAERYALVLWSHGSGWEPSEIERLAEEVQPQVPVTRGELTERGEGDEARQTFFSSSLRTILAKDTPAERAIAFDDGSGHSLDTIELGRVAAEARQILGRPLDLLGMNACQMASAEVAYQLRGSARVYIASQEDMPAESWPYDDLLTRLGAAPALDAEALARLIVARYCAAFRENEDLRPWWGKRGFPPGVTLSALSLDGAERLAAAGKSLADALRQDIAGQLAAIWAAHRQARAFKFRQFDLATFCSALAGHAQASPRTKEAANDVLAALNDPAVVLAREHTASAYDGTGGVSAYLIFPEPGVAPSPYYDETDFAVATGWGAFLKAYHAAV